MNQSFYIGALGAHQQQKSMGVISNNIANINSHGFKGQQSRFNALMYQDLNAAEGGPVKYGTGPCLSETKTNFRPGAAAQTGRVQDYMIQGDGFFALADLATGEISLTRTGAFTMASLEETTDEVDEEGNPITELVYYLSDGNGRFVMDKNGNMIKMDDPNQVQEVGVFDYVNHEGMKHADGSRFLAVNKNGGLMRSDSPAVSGMLETSNVDLAEEMTKVIEAQRAYSMALKMVMTSDEIETTINNLRG